MPSVGAQRLAHDAPTPNPDLTLTYLRMQVLQALELQFVFPFPALQPPEMSKGRSAWGEEGPS